MKRTDLAAILLFLALAVLFFAPVLFGSATLVPFDNLYRYPPWSAFAGQNGIPLSSASAQGISAQPHNPLLDDLILENYAWKSFLNESLRAGEIPLWNPYILAGQPFLAAGQNAALYPLGVLFYILPLANAYAIFAALHFWLAACAMYFLARVLRQGMFASTLGGVIYAFSSFMVVSIVFPMVMSAAAWLPAILAFVELVLGEQEKKQRNDGFSFPRQLFFALLGAILLAVQFLAGHVEMSYYILLVVGFFAAWRMVQITVSFSSGAVNVQSLGVSVALLAGMLALGLALAAIQILPLYELVRLNFREGSASYSDVAGWALPARQIITFLIPDFFGNPTSHAYFDIYQAAWKPAPQGTIFWGIKNYVEAGAYVGILPLAFAIVGVSASFLERRRARATTSLRESTRTVAPGEPPRAVGFFSVLAILSLLFAFGTPLYALLFYGLPGWNQLHTAFRWIFPWTLSIAYLAGAGAQIISNGISRRGLTLLGALLAALGLVTLFIIALSLVIREQFLSLADAFVNASDLARPVFETGQAFWSYQARNFALFGLFVTLTGGVFLVARMDWRARRIPLWKPLALVVVVADLFIAGIGFYPRADVGLANFVPPAIQFLQQDKSLYRVTSYDGPGTKTLNANAAMPFGIQDIRGYDSIIPKQYVEYMRALAPQDELLYNRISAFYDYQPLSSPLLNLLNVKYVVTTRPLPNPGFDLVYDKEVKIYENLNVLPRAFMLGQARSFSGRDELLSALPALNPTREVWLEQAPPIPNSGLAFDPAALPRIDKYTGSEVILHAKTTAPGYLVLADSYFPGWIAQIDGQDTVIYRADGNFRSIAVPAGEHTVRFKYSPVSFRVGAVLSLLAVIAVMLTLVALVWQRFVLVVGGESESQVRTVAKNSIVPMGASLLIQVINFALALVVLRVLGPENNGRYAFAVTVWFFLSAITEFGLGILVTREVSRDRSRANQFLTNGIVLRIGLTLLSIVLLAGVIVFYSATGDLNPETILAMLLLWISLFPNHVAGALSGIFFAYERFEYPTAIEIATSLVSVALQIAVLLAGFGIVGLAGVSIVTNVFTLVIMFYLLRRTLFKPHFAFDRKLARWMFFESYPLMMNNLLANLFFKIDVFLLLPLTNATILGYYNAAYKFVNALNFIPSKFTLAIFPMLSRLSASSTEAMQRAMTVSVKLLVWIAIPITVATVFIAPQLILLFAGAAYLPDSAIALRYLIWFLPFSFVNSVVHYILIALNEQRFLTRAFLIGLAFNIIANLIAIPPLSYVGAALVTVLSEIALLVPFYYALRKHMPPLPIFDMFWRPAVAGAVMGGALYLLLPQNLILALVVASIVYGLVLLVTGALGADEWLLVRKLVPKRFEKMVILLSRGSVVAESTK